MHKAQLIADYGQQVFIFSKVPAASQDVHSASERVKISPTYEFVVEILQEGQLCLEEVHCCYGDVVAPGDVERPQTFAVLHQEEQGSAGFRVQTA